MFRANGINGVGLMLIAMFSSAVLAESPGLGTPLTPHQVAQIDFSVMPDGQGLPPGSGDAGSGAELYQQHCLACHGSAGEQGINDRLAGGRDTIESPAPVKTVGSYWPYATTVFDYIRRAMPYTAPGSLSADEVYALSAYLLFINGVVPEDTMLDATSLPQVVMPNVENFVWAVPGN